MTPDIVTGLFQLFAGILLFRNSWLLFKHKKIRGVSVLPTIFFLMWGFWNLFYYPYLEQMVSFYAGIIVLTANALWIGLAIFYMIRWKKKCRIAKANLDEVMKNV